MDSTFGKSFDELLNALLTDYQNQTDPDGNPIDVSQGSLALVKAACTASALWGLYRYQDHIAAQIFPDTADAANLEHHGSLRGIDRKAAESIPDYLARVLDNLRRPPAGGNKHDYEVWACEVEGIAAATCYPIARGLGTVDVVIVADPDPDTGSEVPDLDLVNEVRAHIEEQRPVTAKDVLVFPVTIDQVDITMTVAGPCDTAQAAADIEAYLGTLAVDQPLYLGQLVAIALANGAVNAVVGAPAADVVPADSHMIRPGAIDVA